ncbi:MAG: phosphate ABC transporter substrate-binding protein [Ignavibacteriales bacterium]|nr:phosphate ABC transporter substrate-binding protein [Ignavibacteriales bacterium]
MKYYKIFLLVSSYLFFACSLSHQQVKTVRIQGSDTMLLLTELLAEEYMKKNPSVSIYVYGGGTSSGVRSLINGEVDICTASRNLTAEEVNLIAEHYGNVGLAIQIAKDGLCIFINPGNPIKDFTIEELKKIFTCQIKNWKELGGTDNKISLIIRNPNSGTHAYLKNYVLEETDYCTDAEVFSTMQDVINAVSENKYAIGYGGFTLKKEISNAKINGIDATESNIINNKYPITRYLFFYTIDNPKGILKEFIDWVLSDEGQKLVKKSGYLPLWEIQY